MGTLEIIHVRLPAGCPDDLIEGIMQLAATREPGVTVGVYRRAGINSDFAIHIAHSASASASSVLGLRLASQIQDFASVRHAVWFELRESGAKAEA